ncbi:type I restriction-modification system subunit M [Spirulina major]|uniref:type I restriction-modification system subunit M n=1 Tax=Spirulina major TaxID=270636 RepID=UPI0009342406|nr:class I SAM-dependent DNA methyltransferase [Spirulina major]
MNTEQLKQLEQDLWSAADSLRANSDLKASEYGTPVLGLIFLKFADINYRRHEEAINQEFEKFKGKRREKPIHEIAIARCGFYLPDFARYQYLLNLPEDGQIATAIERAMEAIEEYKPELAGSLPKDEYHRLTRTPETQRLPVDLLKKFDNIPDDATGDVFGQIYEYFLGKFALAEGQGGGEFFTPRSVVRLMVEIIEPHGGTVFDPACGSGGMFVQSADFIAKHRQEMEAQGKDTSVYVYGQEKQGETVKLARMNLAVNGLRGEIAPAITYYTDVFDSFGRFDYVLANPPFNVDDVSLEAVKDDRRFNTYGIPQNKTKKKKSEQAKETVPNANYLWINLFATSLKEPNDRTSGGRAALVMANSASDARHSEAEIRRTLIEQNLIYGMLTLPSNMFYTVTLPATLWFFDKGKTDDRILFIDARNIFTQVDRAHRVFTEEQIQNIAIISRLHKGRRDEFLGLIDRYFTAGMEPLRRNKAEAAKVAVKLVDALAEMLVKRTIADLLLVWDGLDRLESEYGDYRAASVGASVEVRNDLQWQFRAGFGAFFGRLHGALKMVDWAVRDLPGTTKSLKGELEALHQEVKAAEGFFLQVGWLQDRFPAAQYEDVVGLCKLATLEEIKEQDFSLNPGRYVGVVIEEDGKTEEEFIDELAEMHNSLALLSSNSLQLTQTIKKNIKLLIDE